MGVASSSAWRGGVVRFESSNSYEVRVSMQKSSCVRCRELAKRALEGFRAWSRDSDIFDGESLRGMSEADPMDLLTQARLSRFG